MSLIILSDPEVQHILESLTQDSLTSFRQTLWTALHDFSTSVQAGPGGPYQQPPGMATNHPSANTTSLYSPSSGPEGMSFKGEQLDCH